MNHKMMRWLLWFAQAEAVVGIAKGATEHSGDLVFGVIGFTTIGIFRDLITELSPQSGKDTR